MKKEKSTELSEAILNMTIAGFVIGSVFYLWAEIEYGGLIHVPSSTPGLIVFQTGIGHLALIISSILFGFIWCAMAVTICFPTPQLIENGGVKGQSCAK